MKSGLKVSRTPRPLHQTMVAVSAAMKSGLKAEVDNYRARFDSECSSECRDEKRTERTLDQYPMPILHLVAVSAAMKSGLKVPRWDYDFGDSGSSSECRDEKRTERHRKHSRRTGI